MVDVPNSTISLKDGHTLYDRESLLSTYIDRFPDLPDLARRYSGTIDMAGIRALQRAYPYTIETAHQRPKYVAFPDYWILRNLILAMELGLDRVQGCRILDLGCGCGYFASIVNWLGHDATGADKHGGEIFDEVCAILGIRRRFFKIARQRPLPEDLGTFDRITAFMVVFNGYATGDPWRRADWHFFLANVVGQRLRPGGRLLLDFNFDLTLHDFTDTDSWAYLTTQGSCPHPGQILISKPG